MKNRTIYVVSGDLSYVNWLQGTVVSKMEDADLVLFTGGEDVSPKIYNEPTGSYTGTNWHRDVHEMKEFKKAIELRKHILGICRGSQFTCVMSGGRLVQHQDNPYAIHPIKIEDGKKEILITSTHHQAQYPYDMPKDDYKVLGYTEHISPFHLNGEDKEISPVPFKEVEIGYYPRTKVLGIQGHPEYIWGKNGYKDTFEYLHNLLDKHLNDAI